MAVRVHVPEMLREYSGAGEGIVLAAGTVGDALQELALRFPALHRSVCDETGTVRRHINLFANSSLVPRSADGLQQRLDEGDVLTIWTAVSGG